MAQNVSLWGASYANVPSVLLPKNGGGTASFIDVSDTTADASDVAVGKYFYTAAGVLTEGTSSGGGGTGGISQDANGYLVVSSQGGGGGGSSWTLLAEDDIEVSTTSTSAISVGTVSCTGIRALRQSGQKIICITAFDKAGPRKGYYYGSMTYEFAPTYSGNSFYYKSNGSLDYSSISYGVYPNIINQDSVAMSARYVSSFGTLDGTFTVRIYTLDYPTDINPILPSIA